MRRRVTVDGRAEALAAIEYEIQRILSLHAGRVVTSESLRRQAWDSRESTDTERVKQLGDDASDPALIFSERGGGYRVPEADGT